MLLLVYVKTSESLYDYSLFTFRIEEEFCSFYASWDELFSRLGIKVADIFYAYRKWQGAVLGGMRIDHIFIPFY